MKINQLIFATATVMLSTLNPQLSICFAQGTLTPAGPPGPTMLTLSQVEPRTPVDSVHTPGSSPYEFIINQAGSYYLTTNIVGGSSSAIEITANNVTLDLNGFSLAGNSGPGYGVYIPSPCTNIIVKNGVITGWANDGVYCGATTATFERLTLSGNTIYGLVFGGTGNVNSTARSCTLSGNGTGGISCLANNVTMEDLVVSSNAYGFFIFGVNGDVIRNCTINGNGTEGISCQDVTNLILENLVISGNNNSGGYLPSTYNSVIRDCTFEGSTAYAINLGGNYCSILNNNFNGDAGAIAISGANNQVDGNHIIGNGQTGPGILMYSGAGITNNLIIRNFVTGYGQDFSIGTQEILGPIINTTSSETITNSNPWANFAF